MLQASPQKIDLQRLPADLPFQLGDPAFLNPALSVPDKRLGAILRNSRRQRCSTFGFTSQARATSASEAPNSNRRMASSLNSFVNFRRDNPMAQFLHLTKNEP
jgi:hypothetical protein